MSLSSGELERRLRIRWIVVCLVAARGLGAWAEAARPGGPDRSWLRASADATVDVPRSISVEGVTGIVGTALGTTLTVDPRVKHETVVFTSGHLALRSLIDLTEQAAGVEFRQVRQGLHVGLAFAPGLLLERIAEGDEALRALANSLVRPDSPPAVSPIRIPFSPADLLAGRSIPYGELTVDQRRFVEDNLEEPVRFQAGTRVKLIPTLFFTLELAPSEIRVERELQPDGSVVERKVPIGAHTFGFGIN